MATSDDILTDAHPAQGGEKQAPVRLPGTPQHQHCPDPSAERTHVRRDGADGQETGIASV